MPPLTSSDGSSEPGPGADPAAGRPTHVFYGVLALTVAMSLLLYLDRFALTVVTPEIMDDLSISKSQMGDAVKAFFFAYALCQVPAGWFADRLGPRRALSVYVGAWSLAIAWAALSRTLDALIAARLVLGMSQAGAYPAAAGLIKKWIPFERRGFASGAVTMGGRAGGLLSSVATPYLMSLAAGYFVLESSSLWRPVLILYGVLGLVWAALFSVWFRNSPREHSGVNAAELALIEREPLAKAETSDTTAPAATATTPWRSIATSLNVWLLCLVNFFNNVGWIFLATWLATYLREVHHVSLQTTGWLTAGTALAGMCGCLTGGWATDRLVRKLGLRWGRRTPGMLACGGAAVAYLTCFAGQYSMAIVVASAACASFLSDLVLGTVWASYQDIGGRSVGVVLGFGNMCGNLGAAYFSGKIGSLAEHGNWSGVMLVAAGSFSCSMICWFFIDPCVPIVRASAPGQLAEET